MPGPGYKRHDLPGPSKVNKPKVRHRRKKKLRKHNKRVERRERREKRALLKAARRAAAMGDRATGKGSKVITRQQNRAARRDIRRTQYNQTLSEDKTPEENKKIGFKPSTKDILGDQIERDIRATDPGAIHPGVGVASQVAKPIANALVTLGAPEGRAVDAAGSIGRRVVKSIGRTAKAEEKAAAKAAAKEGEKVAVKTGKREAGERTAGKAARRAEKKSAKDLKNAARKRARSSRPERVKLRTKTKNFAKRHRPTVTSGKTAMKGAANERVRKAVIAGGVAAPVVAGPGAAVVQNTVEAAREDPERFRKTSTSALGGLVTSAVEIPKAAVEAATGNTAPAESLIEGYKDYLKDYPTLADPGSEKAQKKILNKYGATPLITGALGVHAATRPILARFPKVDVAREPKVARQGIRVRRVSKIKRDAQSADPKKSHPAQQALARAEKHKLAKEREVAQEYDRGQHQGRASFVEDMREKGGTKHRFRDSFRELERVPLKQDKYNLADALRAVHAMGVPLDARAGRQVLIDMRDSLVEPNGTVSKSARDIRVILDDLIEHPELLEHPSFKHTESQLRAIRSDQTRGVDNPDPRDRARHVPQARTYDIDTPEERVPLELRDVVDIKPKRFQRAPARLRERARALTARAKAKEAEAKKLPEGVARTAVEREAANLIARAERIKMVVNRPRRAKWHDAQAVRARKAGDEEAALRHEQTALNLRREHKASQDQIYAEFHSDMDALRSRKGLREPIFFRELDARDAGSLTRGGKEVPAAGAAPKEKFRSGQLHMMGLVDESGDSVIESIYRDRMNVAMNQTLRRILQRFADNDSLVTGRQMRRMVEDGEVPPGVGLIPMQDFKRAYAAGDEAHVLGLIDDAKQMREAIKTAQFEPGKKYAMIPTSVLNEIYGQAKGVGQFAKGLKAFGGAQSLLMLGTSPSWAFYQGFATPLVLMAREPNPLIWMQTAKHMVDAWRKIPRRKRVAFYSLHAGTVGDVQGHFKFDKMGPTPNNVRAMAFASDVARRTFAGKLVQSFRQGGPLIKGVAAYERFWRRFATVLEMDKLFGDGPWRRFANSLADLDEETRRSIQATRGMSQEQLFEHFGDPKNTRPLAGAVNSTLGDWSSMTTREKRLFGSVIFYPFLRFSLKWVFHTFPKDHPIKAAVLLNLAQQNADEIRNLLGNDPTFFQTYGQIPMPNSEGEVLGGPNLARIGPAGNALIEALGNPEGFNPANLARVIQPWLATTVLTAGFGIDPLTGEQKADTTEQKALLALKGILTTSPPARAWAIPALETASSFLAPSATAQHFRNADGRGSVDKALNPFSSLTFSVAKERADQQASEILDKAGSGPTPEEIGQMAEHIATTYPGLNQAQLREKPEVLDFIRRARVADKNSNIWSSVLEAEGLGSPEVDHTFKNLMALIKPIGGLDQKPTDRRTEAQRVRFLKKNKGLSGKEIQRQFPGLPTAYASRIEALRRSGMTDREIAAKYPYLRKHLPSLNSSSSIGSSSIGSSSIGGSSIGGSSIGD